jgi:hypothetical protein
MALFLAWKAHYRDELDTINILHHESKIHMHAARPWFMGRVSKIEFKGSRALSCDNNVAGA